MNNNLIQNEISYSLNDLIRQTKKMDNLQIKSYINELVKKHKLDNFNPSEITDMNNIYFNKHNGELSWKCIKHGYCTCDLYDLFLNENKMLNNFDNGCGYCE